MQIDGHDRMDKWFKICLYIINEESVDRTHTKFLINWEYTKEKESQAQSIYLAGV